MSLSEDNDCEYSTLITDETHIYSLNENETNFNDDNISDSFGPKDRF
jgi:hypothetical protein